ncbi:MAG: HAD-IIB family hydrolase [Candidatus Omnitrophota bacterium]
MKFKSSKLFKIIALLICFVLCFEQSGFAQIAAQLDISGKLSGLVNSIAQDKFRPLHLRYLQYDTKLNNFKLLLDKGSSKELSKPFIEQSTKTLLNYFLAGVTLPNDTFWVNLRPDSPDNVIDPALAQTDIGRIMLEADVQLKKDTASFTSPNTPEGKQYWDKLYTKAGELFGSQNITIPTLTRPWIVPNEIIIRETIDNAYIYKATLKVMLEDDYLKEGKGIGTGIDYSFKDEKLKQLNQYSSELIRQLIIPKLTKEINTSKRYANLRQVYYSLILAQWFKQRFANNSGAYSKLINQKNLTNLTSKTSWSKDTYFQQYQKSFKDGEYNIKTPVSTPYGQVIRSYFSGGIRPIPQIPAPGEVSQDGLVTSVKGGELFATVTGSDKLAGVSIDDGVVKTTDQAQPSNGFKIEDQTTPPKVENGISVRRVDLSKLPVGTIIKYRISNDNWNYTLRVEANGRVSIWLREDQGRITASIKAIGSRVPSLTPGDAYDADFFGEIEPGVLAYQPYFNQTDIAGSKVRELVSIGDYPIQATPEDIMVYLPDGKTQLPREKPRALQDKFKRKVKELNEFIVHHGIPGENPLEANGFEFLVKSGITKVEILAERLGMDKDSLEEILSAVEEQKGWDIIEKTIDTSTFSFAFEKLAKLQAEKNLYPKPQKTIKEKAYEFKDKVIKFVKDETGALQLTGYRQDKKFNQKIAMDKKLAGFYAIAEDLLEQLQKFPDKQDLVIELIENKFNALVREFPKQRIELNNAKNELVNELAINLSSGQQESIYLHGYYEILKNILNKLIPWTDDLKKKNPDSEFIFVARDAGYIYSVFNALGKLGKEKAEGFVYYLSRASMSEDLIRNGPYDTARRMINQAHSDTKTDNINELTGNIRKEFKDYLEQDDRSFLDETSRKEYLEFKNMVIKVNSELKALGYDQLQKLVLVETGFKGTMPFLIKFILDLDKTDEQLANEAKENGGQENIQVAILEPRDIPAFTDGVYGLTAEQAETEMNKFEDFWGGQAVETPESVVDLLEKEDISHPIEFNLIDSRVERNSNPVELLKYFVNQLVVGLETIEYYKKTRKVDVEKPVNKSLAQLSPIAATKIIGSALDKGNNSLDGLIAETPDYTGKLVQLQNPKQMSAGNFDGTSHLQFTDDPQGKAGQVWLFKGYPRQKWHRALVDEFVYHIAEKLGLKSAIPVFAGRIKNGYMTEFGMFMRWEENIGSLYEVYRGDFIQKLSENKENLKTVLREQVLDWLVSQHDSHSRNFLIADDKDKSLIPIDFSQAFKFLGKDELSLDYNPNGDVNGYNNVAYMPIYNLIYQAIINKEIDFTLTEAWEVVQEVLERVEEMDTDEYIQALKPYAEFRFKIMKDASWSIRNSDEFLKLARERKVNMRKDFEKFYKKLGFSSETDYRFSLLEIMENPLQEKQEFYVDQFNALWIFNENQDLATKPYKSLAAKTYHQFMGKVLDRNSIVLETTFKAKDGRIRTGTMQKVFYQEPSANKQLKELNLADFRDWSQNRVSIKFWGLEPPKIKQVLEEMVIDWLFSNYSSTESTWFEHGYAKFYLICLDDKSDSFKDFPNDRLEAKKDSDDKIKPPFAYNLVKYLALQNRLSMDLIEEILKKIESIPDNEVEELIRPLAKSYVATNPDKFKRPEDFIKAFLSRKDNLRKDFKEFFHQNYLLNTPFNSQVQTHQAMTDKYIISSDLYQQIHNARGDQTAIIKLINQRFNELAENLSWEEVEPLAQKKEELIIRITGPPVLTNQDVQMDLQTNPIVRDRKFKAMSRLLASWVYSLREQKPDYYLIGLARDGGYIPLIDQLFNYAGIIPKTGSSVYHLSCPRMSGETQKKIYSMMYEIIANALKNVEHNDIQGLYAQIRLGFNKAMAENSSFLVMVTEIRKELIGLGFDQKNKIVITDTGFFGTIAFYIKCILDMDKSQARLEQELVDNHGHENIEVAILQPSSIESFNKSLFGFDTTRLTQDDQAIARKLETIFGLRNVLGNEFESNKIMHPVKFNEDNWLIEDTDASSQLELFYQQIMIAQMVDAFIAREGIDYPGQDTLAGFGGIDLDEKIAAQAFFDQPDNGELKVIIDRWFKELIAKDGYVAFKKLYDACGRLSFIKLLRLKFPLLSTNIILTPNQEFKRQSLLVQYLLKRQGILTSSVPVARKKDPKSLPFEADKKFSGVLLDVDGTITMPGGEISDAIIEKVEEMITRGNKVGIVTGRRALSPDVFEEVIKLKVNRQALNNLYIFTQDGAQGYSVGDTNLRWEFKTGLNERKKILKKLERSELVKFHCQIIPESAKLIFKMDNHDDTDDLILTLKIALVDLGLDAKYSVVDAGANVHLIASQADKGAAAKKFSNVTGLAQENILKIGDNYNLDGNDYPMLALPGGVGVNDSETTLWLLDTYFKNTVLTPNIQLFALTDEGTDPLSNSLHFVNNKDITSVILPKNKFAASVDMLKVFEESLQYELGKVPLFSIFGSLSYARDKEGNIIWDTIGDFDIKLYTEELLWNDDITEIKLNFLNALKNLGIKVDIQGSDSPSGSGRDLSSLNWGILDKQGKKYIVHIINFRTKDLLSKNDAFVNIRSNLFYGDTQALNNALNIVGIETAVEQAAVSCEKTISIISNAIAKVENIRSENVKLLKRLYQIAYVQGREADFYWLLEKYRKLSLEFNQQDLADACNEGISKLIMNPEELRALLRDRLKANIKLVDSKSMATVAIPGAASDKGGVDFRGLPIGIQSQRMIGASAVLIPSPRLDQEWSQIERMLNQGIIPSIERLKDYLSLSCKGADCSARVDQTLSGIANILRIEEESLTPTDAALKQLLILLESNQPANQLQLALTKIQASEKMPELAIH